MIKGSRLRSTLETTHAPVTFEHMLSGKGCARPLRDLLLPPAAILSLIFEGFWNRISDEVQEGLRDFAPTK